jgi:membrane-associated phospholipid phosphatase
MLNLMRDLGLYQCESRRRLRPRALAVLSVSAAVLIAPALGLGAGAQAPVQPTPVVSWQDARLAGLFTLVAAAVMPLDRDGQRVTQRRWVQDAPLLAHGADAFNAYGSPGVMAASAALYAAGWATGRPAVARLGMRAGEAIMLSGVVTGALKGVAGRARPRAHPGAPGDFRLTAGITDDSRQSFPSGHATAAFAFAGALHRELRASHPRRARWVGPVLYTAAALTSAARMHADKHWASDVLMGAGIGVVSSQVVARFHAERPAHWLDGRLLPRLDR